MSRSILFLLLLFSTSIPFAQRIISGPMLGYNEMREVEIWLQTDEPCEVRLSYWPEGTKQPAVQSAPAHTQKDEACTAHVQAVMLEPGTTYTYEILINGKAQPLAHGGTFTTQKLWQYREEPPTWTMALGSCAFLNEPAYDRPGTPYGQSPEIFESIADKSPELMLWLGDNLYFREVDWFTRSGMLHRYSHLRSQPELQRLMATAHHYAIWDDHDFGPNDANSSWVHKDWAKHAFELFWSNNRYGTPELPGITSFFKYNDADFFLLDNRWHRTDHDVIGDEQTVLGDAQIDWLINALKDSRAPFKLVAVGGQFLSDFAKYENYANYAEERQEIIDRIADNNIDGVVFLTGDRHSTELTQWTAEGKPTLFDLTCSPLTSKAYDHSEETNTLRVPGTSVGTQNFATLTFNGPYKSRQMTIRVYDAKGAQLWYRTISATGEIVGGNQPQNPKAGKERLERARPRKK